MQQQQRTQVVTNGFYLEVKQKVHKLFMQIKVQVKSELERLETIFPKNTWMTSYAYIVCNLFGLLADITASDRTKEVGQNCYKQL